MYSSPFNLKIIALIIAVGLWYCFTYDKFMISSFYAPLCFDDCSYTIKEAPDKILVTIKGRRSDLYAFDCTQYAIHIDESCLKNDKNYIYLDDKKMLLPMEISLVSFNPSSIMVEREKIKTQDINIS